MADLRPRKCVSCGAPIEVGATKCSYCGMTYEPDYWAGTLRYVPLRMGRKKLVAKAEIPWMPSSAFTEDPEGLARFVRSDLIGGLAAGLAEVATIRVSNDWNRDVVIVQGEVWVEMPDRRAELGALE